MRISRLPFFYPVVLIAACYLSACSTEADPPAEAQRLELETLSATPGYAWFQYEMDEFVPNDTALAAINASFDAAQHRAYVFVDPGCSCTGTRKLFPQVVKILTAAGVGEENIEIYSMRSAGDRHPYETRMTVRDLPTIFITRNDDTVGTITELPGEGELEKLVLAALQQ